MGLGDRLRVLRLQKEISQTKLAHELGLINNSYVSDIENNKFCPSEDKLRLWAKALGITWEEMNELLVETQLEDLGIKDAGFTMMFKEVPNMTYEEKESVLRAFQAVLKARSNKRSNKG